MRFHGLRHTAATNLVTQGVHPKVASEMLGHTAITLTRDTSSRLMRATHAQAAATMDTVLDDHDSDFQKLG